MSLTIDHASLLVRVPGAVTIAQLEEQLRRERLTLAIDVRDPSISIADWLASGAPGAPSAFTDPADHLVAGLSATLANGRRLEVRPAPRRAVGPDLIALVVGAKDRFATIDRAWLRVHPIDQPRRPPFEGLTETDAEAPISPEEATILDQIADVFRSL
jgi:alkyldihydroxyacetonephosphate synthase